MSPCDEAPLTKAASASKSGAPGLSFAVSLVPTLRKYPVGALFGLVLTGVATITFGVTLERIWLEIPITLICVPGCMMIESLLDWRFSGRVDARMRHDAAHEDARRAFEKLDDYKARGVINKPDAYKMGTVIAKRDVAGGPRERRAPRASSRRREPPSPPGQGVLRHPDGPSSPKPDRPPK